MEGYGLFLLLSLPALALGLWAQFRVRSAFKKNAQIRTATGMTGAQVAQRILQENNLYDVKVERVEGFLSDHYDPRHKVLRLSPDVYEGNSLAAAGVAAHEVGHALQHQHGYAALNLRSALVPAANFGSMLAPLLFMGGLMLDLFIQGTGLGYYLSLLGVGLFGLAVLFTLITLPVEFDASRRAKKLLVSNGLLFEEEMQGVNKVLDAAALTYVAAAVAAIGQLLYYVAILSGRRD